MFGIFVAFSVTYMDRNDAKRHVVLEVQLKCRASGSDDPLSISWTRRPTIGTKVLGQTKSTTKNKRDFYRLILVDHRMTTFRDPLIHAHIQSISELSFVLSVAYRACILVFDEILALVGD